MVTQRFSNGFTNKLKISRYLQQAITAVQAGEFDALLSDTLESIAARFNQAPAKPLKNPETTLRLMGRKP
jgi:hypothetical protein